MEGLGWADEKLAVFSYNGLWGCVRTAACGGTWGCFDDVITVAALEATTSEVVALQVKKIVKMA